ncbi:MAG: AraC family transcriptional regulator [Victivallales bacterium]|nr:AraC family transcriptional regulator [Victivallales bacterium]
MREDIIYCPQPDNPAAPVRLWLAGISYCDGSYRISRTASPHYVFEYVVRGEGYLRGEGREYRPRSGDVYILPEGSAHEYGSDAADPWEKLWFNAGGPLVRAMMHCYGLDGVWYVPNCPVERLFRHGLALFRRDPAAAHDAAALILHRLIGSVAGTVTRRKPVRHDPDAVRLKRYIDANMQRKLSLGDFCRCIGKSPSQVLRLFRREWGVTPYRYLLERRIDLAALYLRHTAKPLKEIAAELHFADEYYFSHVFRRKKGIAPGRYRRDPEV